MRRPVSAAGCADLGLRLRLFEKRRVVGGDADPGQDRQRARLPGQSRPGASVRVAVTPSSAGWSWSPDRREDYVLPGSDRSTEQGSYGSLRHASPLSPEASLRYVLSKARVEEQGLACCPPRRGEYV